MIVAAGMAVKVGEGVKGVMAVWVGEIVVMSIAVKVGDAST